MIETQQLSVGIQPHNLQCSQHCKQTSVGCWEGNRYLAKLLRSFFFLFFLFVVDFVIH